MQYDAFLDGKRRKPLISGVEPTPLHGSLYDFQVAITKWAIRRGRAAIFADCGLGKTRMQIEYVRQMGGRGLIVCPLSVAEQTISEGKDIGVPIRYITRP